MELLKYEFQSATGSNYKSLLAQLVKKVRFYKNEVSTEEYNNVLPNLRKIEEHLQFIDASAGKEKRNYIQEILEELKTTELISKQKPCLPKYSNHTAN